MALSYSIRSRVRCTRPWLKSERFITADGIVEMNYGSAWKNEAVLDYNSCSRASLPLGGTGIPRIRRVQAGMVLDDPRLFNA